MSMGQKNILLIGGGGREHAMAWKLAQSEKLDTLYIAPGNPGTAECGINTDIAINDFQKVLDFVEEKSIDIVVVGPEAPLVNGIADFLESKGVVVFGPSSKAAKLEGSKAFAKSFMEKYDIPTAGFRSFSSGRFDEALDHIKEQNSYPVVLKADGLAGGKGVFICDNFQEVTKRLNQMEQDKHLKEAAGEIVVEEFMEGEEASVFVISDGHTALILHNAQDHKRIGEGDTGLNTGGMGAYCPTPLLSDELLEDIEKNIISPTITGMQVNESPYTGILYIGLMITEDGPKVVEYNCRFGDPECQVILPSLNNDLLELIIATADQNLDEITVQTDNDFRCCVVMASTGYPVQYEKGKKINGIESVDKEALIFHAGTITQNGELLTNGGRVLNVVGRGSSLEKAIDHAYENVHRIHFENAYYRNDIGAKGIKYK
jgi:phosphoribosylamine---glycine ligase